MSEDYGFEADGSKKSTSAKQGRRAAQAKQTKAPATPDFETTQSNDSLADVSASKADSPPKHNRISGWSEDGPKKRGRNLGEGMEQLEDERLRAHTPDNGDDSDADIPVIPDLEDQQEEDITTIAAAPNVAVNRVATYRELDNDLLKQAAFLTLDGEVDLKLLTKSLSTDVDLIEEDKPWEWDRLFTEVTSELLTQWEKTERPESADKEPIAQNA